MAKRLSRSGEERCIEQVNQTYNTLVAAIDTSFMDGNFLQNAIFQAKNPDEITAIKTEEIQEIERYTSFDILSAIEAMFMLDYHYRCEKREKDAVSREFRRINKWLTTRVEFQKHILGTWAKYNPQNKVLNELNTILLCRHWLAHGRYWLLDRNAAKYDYNYLYSIALQIKGGFNLFV
jgi:hypothetical protein